MFSDQWKREMYNISPCWRGYFYLKEASFMGNKDKRSEKVAEKNYEPNKQDKSDKEKSLENVHEQINQSFNQGTIDEKKEQKDHNSHNEDK